LLTIYIDADACPVKEEVYRVAGRYDFRVVVVANSVMRVPAGGRVEMVFCRGFGAADDHIAEHAGAGDVVITADLPLAGRVLANHARVLDPRGRPLTDADIGPALAAREINEERRQYGAATGGPPPMTAKDRSRFLAKLDEALNAVRRQFPAAK
jgi:uncharacterized protein YaiI (UPF0178 family)